FADSDHRQKENKKEMVMAEADAFVAVISAFGEADKEKPAGLLTQLETVLLDLVLSDLERIERRRQKGEKERRAGLKLSALESKWLDRCQERLEAGSPLFGMDFTPEEETVARSYSFLSRKPMIVVANVSEENLTGSGLEPLIARCREIGLECLPLCASLEAEISRLEPEEQAAFLNDYRLQAPAKDRLIQSAYRMMRLISFFTVGEDEVKAWTLRCGASAQQAAGKIHSDIERGFIRAEVVSFVDFKRDGSLSACKGHGALRLESKEYLVQDGEIVHFRFNV
ncbi:MAG: DUF933 domain-containing protein, partial [Thermodesulfobacteriota bacterium]